MNGPGGTVVWVLAVVAIVLIVLLAVNGSITID